MTDCSKGFCTIRVIGFYFQLAVVVFWVSGCTLMIGSRDKITALGLLGWIRETRQVESGDVQTLVGRQICVKSPLLSGSICPHRIGFFMGYSGDRLLIVHESDALTSGLQQWSREAYHSKIPFFFKVFPKPPDTRGCLRHIGIENFGLGLNKLEMSYHLAVGYSETTWMLGLPGEADIGFFLAEDGKAFRLFPRGKDPAERKLP
jgi:hypothetical protein